MTTDRTARLRRVTLRDFKGFHEATLELGDFTVVVGTNASGKSNLRDAFRFLHGIARGYTLSEIIGEKWIEGGVLQWKGLRGGTKEAAYTGSDRFAIEIEIEVPQAPENRALRYDIEVQIPQDGQPPRVISEKLLHERRASPVFQTAGGIGRREMHVTVATRLSVRSVRLRDRIRRLVRIDRMTPAIPQLAEERTIRRSDIAWIDQALAALTSMRFLDLSPDAMRVPSLPGQTILGDRGENLSSVLQAICNDNDRKDALIGWLRQLTPLDVVDFDFVADAAGRILTILVEAGGRRTSAYSASDGTLRFLAMIAAFLGPEPARFYFFEELDTGLHPTRLHLLLDLISKQTALGVSQVVATTHSPQLLSLLDDKAMDAATLAYRLPGTHDQRLIRINQIPDAIRVLRSHDVAKLFSTGWLEDAVDLMSDQIAPSKSGAAAE